MKEKKKFPEARKREFQWIYSHINAILKIEDGVLEESINA